jgi:hypothetical protein
MDMGNIGIRAVIYGITGALGAAGLHFVLGWPEAWLALGLAGSGIGLGVVALMMSLMAR